MTGAVTVAAVVGLLSLLAGVALGWYLRGSNDDCLTCSEPDQPGHADSTMMQLPQKTLSGS